MLVICGGGVALQDRRTVNLDERRQCANRVDRRGGRQRAERQQLDAGRAGGSIRRDPDASLRRTAANDQLNRRRPLLYVCV